MDVDGPWHRWIDWSVIFLLALGGRLAYWAVAGTRVVGDATAALQFCTDFSVANWTIQQALGYSGFQLPYCGFLYLTNGFVDGWVFLQVVFSAVSCVLLYETARLLVDRLAGLVAGVSFALVWEVFHWVVRPMSEPVFTIVATVVLWRLAVYEVDPTRRNRVLAVGAIAYLAITRPNGLPIAIGYLAWDTVYKSGESRLDLFPARRINLALIFVFGLLAVFRLTGIFGLVGGGITMPDRYLRGVIVTGHVWYDFTSGWIYYAIDPDPARTASAFSPAMVYHVVVISLLRGLWFFAPVLPGWSLPHVALSAFTLFPLIVGGIVGSYVVARENWTLFKHWVTPVVMIVLTATIAWVAGSRNFLGPAVASFSLLSGYLVSRAALRWDLPILAWFVSE